MTTNPAEPAAASERPKIAVIYYSATGNVHALAHALAEGAQQAGAEVRVRHVEELASELAISQKVVFIDVPPEAMREALLGVGLPPWQADGLIEDYAHYRRGEAAAVASGVKDATGSQPRSFADFARDCAPAFS